jgi:membrane protein CcdC involved in cytochrome C biogenesis
MKNKGILLTAIFLIVSTGNYFRIVSKGSIRTVEFLSIFVIGVLFGLLITQIIKEIKDQNDNK